MSHPGVALCGADRESEHVSEESEVALAAKASSATDDGRWDGDTVWDRAVGPFQFIPSSWTIFGGDGNDDGLADPNDVFDAVPAMRRCGDAAMRRHLCPGGQIVDIGAAIFSYHRSREYVEAVLGRGSPRTGAVPRCQGENFLAGSIDTLRIYGTCECSDITYGSFYTGPRPDGALGRGPSTHPA